MLGDNSIGHTGHDFFEATFRSRHPFADHTRKAERLLSCACL